MGIDPTAAQTGVNPLTGTVALRVRLASERWLQTPTIRRRERWVSDPSQFGGAKGGCLIRLRRQIETGNMRYVSDRQPAAGIDDAETGTRRMRKPGRD